MIFQNLKYRKKDNIEEYTLEDISWIENYKYHDPLSMTMIA